ncbi:MAG: PhoH family protein [Flavobacteriales bacterium]
MSEKIIVIDSVNPVDFFGAGNKYLKVLKDLFPKLRIVDRGAELRIFGEPTEIDTFRDTLMRIMRHYERFGSLDEEVIHHLARQQQQAEPEDETEDENDFEAQHVILVGNDGLLVKARTENQQKLVKVFQQNDMIFALGPSGTGKTYTAVALAVKALKNKEIRRIILTRPAVEAGENLGFLPGDLKEKLDPYLQPLFDALRDMIPPEKLKTYMESGIIQIAPLAYMRGRTLDNAYVILDEAQNATRNQMKMFLTRMGQTAKFVITGDMSQVDLPRNQQSGLQEAYSILKNVKGIGMVEFDKSDVIRHKLVRKVLEAYEKIESKNS